MPWSVFPPQISRGPGRDRARASTVRGKATNRMNHGRVNFWCFQILVALYAMPDQNHRKNIVGNI